MRKILLIIIVFLIGVAAVVTSISISNQKSQTSQQNTQNNVVVTPIPDNSITNRLINKLEISWPWYLTRASGMVAGISLVILMLSGVGLITGHTFSFFEPLTAWASHRALGITFAVAVTLHVVALYFDNFVPFSIIDLLVPFASTYKRIEIFGLSVGSLYVALGVLSLYIAAAITLTSLFWIEKAPKTWKVTHILSYLAVIMVFFHALFLGTDLAGGIFRVLWIVLAGVVAYACLARLWRAKSV